MGLGPLTPTLKGRGFSELVLVKDRKDAAVFTWEDPYDDGK